MGQNGKSVKIRHVIWGQKELSVKIRQNIWGPLGSLLQYDM